MSRATGRPPGRPRSIVPGSTVTARVPAPMHDHLIAIAKIRQQSVSSLVRAVLEASLRPASRAPMVTPGAASTDPGPE